MMRCIYSTTSSEVFVVGHSQVFSPLHLYQISFPCCYFWCLLNLFMLLGKTIMSLAALIQPDIAEEVVEAAALFFPISYLEHHFKICCLLYIICSEWVVWWLCWLLGVVVYDFAFYCWGFSTMFPRCMFFFFFSSSNIIWAWGPSLPTSLGSSLF